MAMKAANQIAEKCRSVKGFQSKDVSFHTPLKLTLDPPGVEMMFYLRPVKMAIEREFDFKLCVHEERNDLRTVAVLLRSFTKKAQEK